MFGRMKRELLRRLTMAARMNRARLANQGHQEGCSRGDSVTALLGAQTGVRLRKNAAKRGTSFLQGPFVPQDKLKPIESSRFTSAPFEAQDELKHRPPKEKDLFPQPVCATKGAWPI
jgi:hypothetical protein